MPRIKHARTRPTLVTMNDRDRSIDDWGKLKVVALKLKCNQYSLSENGNKPALQKRLHEHFHQERRASESESDESSESHSPTDAYENEYEDEFNLEDALQQSDNDLFNPIGEENPPPPADPGNNNGDRQDDENPDENVRLDDTRRDDIGDDGQNGGIPDNDRVIMEQEIRALRSTIANLSNKRKRARPQTQTNKRRHKQRAPSTPHQDSSSVRARQHRTPSSVRHARDSTTISRPNNNNGGQLQPPPQQQQQTQATLPSASVYNHTAQQLIPGQPSQPAPLMSVNTNYSVPDNSCVYDPNVHYNNYPGNCAYGYQYQQPQNPSYQQQHGNVASSATNYYNTPNPFTPPATSAKLLKKIQRLEFVDFVELLPNNAMSDSDMGGQSHINVSKHSKTFHGAARKEKIDSYSKWCLAWNITM